MQIFNDQVIFGVAPKFLKLFEQNVSTINTATPNVSGLHLAVGGGVVVTVTNMIGGIQGQVLRILGDGTTTMKNGTNIFTNTAADKLLASNKIYTFTCYNNKWYENA